MSSSGAKRGNGHTTDVKLTFLVAALRCFPQWAIWLPQQGQWTAVRTKHGMRPGEQAQLVWVQASSAGQLCRQMQRAERQLQTEARRRARQLAATDGHQP
jgi:hypothetical protein